MNRELCERSTRGLLQDIPIAMTDRVKQRNSQDSECHALDANPALPGQKSEAFPLEMMCLMRDVLNPFPTQVPLWAIKVK